ncbi:Clavaminate synthase-like protein [Xylariaceae sp. FL0662B]|nr:Clavaminate synthase-like protein [Xylariaceae sp. FL0662B]
MRILTLPLARSNRWPTTFISTLQCLKRAARFYCTHDESNKQRVSSVKTVIGDIGLDLFRHVAWHRETPLLLSTFHTLPAMKRWFRYEPDGSHIGFEDNMRAYEDTILSYEFISPPVPANTAAGYSGKNLAKFLEWLQLSAEYRGSYLPQLVEALVHALQNDTSRFHQFVGPLSLIMSACEFNRTRGDAAERITQLYVAQSNLSSLPESLARDLPVPDLVKQAGKGDVYDSSIWLGLQPTYTPLHRDPNPNLFCQMVGHKTIRLMLPQFGSALYSRVRRELGSMGNSRFRGTEMMEGPERELLHRAVWGDVGASPEMQEAHLGPGDALFIPNGWWHSVISTGEESRFNASVNWWFR